MSKKNRYKMIKKIFPNHFILFVFNSNYSSYMLDFILLKYLKNKKNLESYLEEKEISYVIIDNITIIKEKKYSSSNFNLFFFRCFLKEIVKKNKR